MVTIKIGELEMEKAKVDHRVKLSRETKRKIKEEYLTRDITQMQLALKYGVVITTIGKIVHDATL